MSLQLELLVAAADIAMALVIATSLPTLDARMAKSRK